MIRRASIGAIAGSLAWIALHPLLLLFPEPIRFAAAWLLFTGGPGLPLTAPLTQDFDPLERTVLALAVGSAAVPVLVEIVGRAGYLGSFPFIALAAAGIGLALLSPRKPARKLERSDLIAAILIVVLALGTGAIVFSHRLIQTPDAVQIYGDYDSFDLSHYAAWASDATHTIPPRAAFYSGHRLNAAYYPQMILTMVHRFADVPFLPMYFRYAWPMFLALGGLTVYSLTRLLAPAGTALLAAVLLLLGGDFSYLAAWLLPHQTMQWDYLLWPTNFLSPTMEVLHFNTWGPTLPIFFVSLYALVLYVRTGSRGWLLVSAFVTAALFQFKPFAYIVLMAGLFGAFLFAGREWLFRRRLVTDVVLTGIFTLPLIYDIVTMRPEDQRSRLLLGFFVLPQRMLIKLDLTETFASLAARWAPMPALQTPLFLVMATVLFLAVGIGIRWFGMTLAWRAVRGRLNANREAWRILAWIALAGITIPFVLATEPYADTLQFYQTGLFILWIFAAAGLASPSRRSRLAGCIVIALAIALALPSSIHYLVFKWNDTKRPVVATLSRSELSIAEYLRTQDPESTVILHDNPTAPSLLAIVSERRVVLGWGRGQYAVGSAGRVRDVDNFFRSEAGSADEAMEILKRYQVTHVVVRTERDRVNRETLAQLKLLMSFPDATLYAVPGI